MIRLSSYANERCQPSLDIRIYLRQPASKKYASSNSTSQAKVNKSILMRIGYMNARMYTSHTPTCGRGCMSSYFEPLRLQDVFPFYHGIGSEGLSCACMNVWVFMYDIFHIVGIRVRLVSL